MAIRSYGSRRIKRFVRGKRGVYASALESRIDRLLDRLRRGATPAQLEAVGYHVHLLTADLEGYYSVAISGGDRVIFRFKDGDAYDVDVVDYHRS